MADPDPTPISPPIPVQGPVVFQAPPGGWSRETYRAAIHAFTEARGCSPQTVTMHPHTLGEVTRLVVRQEAERVLERVREVVQRDERGLEQMLEQTQQAVT